MNESTIILTVVLSIVFFVLLIFYYTDALFKLTVSETYDNKKNAVKALIPFYNWYKIIVNNYNNLPSAKEK